MVIIGFWEPCIGLQFFNKNAIKFVPFFRANIENFLKQQEDRWENRKLSKTASRREMTEKDEKKQQMQVLLNSIQEQAQAQGVEMISQL